MFQAVSYQKKAVIVCERIFGVDHPDTIIAYVSSSRHERSKSTGIFFSLLSTHKECFWALRTP